MPGNKCSNCIAFEYECTYLAGTDVSFALSRCPADFIHALYCIVVEALQRRRVRLLPSVIKRHLLISSSYVQNLENEVAELKRQLSKARHCNYPFSSTVFHANFLGPVRSR